MTSETTQSSSDDVTQHPQAQIVTSAGPLVAGVGAMMLAAILAMVGQAQILSSLTSYSGPEGFGWLVTAGIIALVGAALFLYGLYELASHVDRLAAEQRQRTRTAA